jgi:hypothetical protein
VVVKRQFADLRGLARMQGLSTAADAFFAVSLADSLFFNVSIEAARPRLLLYLVITMAPFAVLAPFIGPFIDRVRGGQRTVLVATCAGRAALTLALSQDLRSLLLFPEAFGVLVLGKAYSVGRSATVPRLVQDERRLVAANAFLARTSLIGSAVGGSAAAVVLATSQSSAVLHVATVLFLLAAMAATAVRSPRRSPRRQTRLEYHELHAARMGRAVEAMGLLRASVGLLTFLIAFALKRSGAPVWLYGLTVAAGGLGTLAATMLSAGLRRRFSEERLLVIAMAVPAVVALFGAVQFGPVTAMMVSAAVGLGASAGKFSFDSIVQHNAPDANLGRAFAGFETRFQLYWIAGATLPIIAQPDARLGLLAMGVVLGGAAIVINVALSASDRFEAPPTLLAAVTRLVLEDAPEHAPPVAVLDAAEGLLRGGSPGAAVIAAAAALEAHRDSSRPRPGPGADRLDATFTIVDRLRDSVVAGRGVTVAEAEHAIDSVRELIGRDADAG